MSVVRPDRAGYVERGGVRVHYTVYGSGHPPVMFLPPWAVVHSRIWKSQVPCVARRCRVVTFDPRGNGRSDRPVSPEAYADDELIQDALDVMDAAGVPQAVLVGFSQSAWHAALLAARYPERVLAAVLAGSVSPLGRPLPERTVYSFEDPLPTDEGWAKYNRHYWQRDYRGFLEFFMAKIFTEPHSTKHIEDGVSWGLETTPEVLTATVRAPTLLKRLRDRPDEAEALYRSIRCALLVVHGSKDALVSWSRGAAIAEVTGAPFVTVEGSGHHVFGRDPVRMNLLLRTFIDERVLPVTGDPTRGRTTAYGAPTRRIL
jgi:pimeloyl-ACP methyl ester carboxylesterase